MTTNADFILQYQLPILFLHEVYHNYSSRFSVARNLFFRSSLFRFPQHSVAHQTNRQPM